MGCRAQRVVHTRQTRPHQVSRALAAQKRAAQQDAQLAARLAGALIAVSGSSKSRRSSDTTITTPPSVYKDFIE